MKNHTIEELRKLNIAKQQAKHLLAKIRYAHPAAGTLALLVEAQVELMHAPALHLVQHLHAGATAARQSAERALGEYPDFER